MPQAPKRRDEDLATTDSFNLLFVIFGLGLLVLVGWNLYQRLAHEPREPRASPAGTAPRP